MEKRGMTKLKITIITTNETNKSIEELIYKNIAKAIYNSPEFQSQLASNKEVS